MKRLFISLILIIVLTIFTAPKVFATVAKVLSDDSYLFGQDNATFTYKPGGIENCASICFYTINNINIKELTPIILYKRTFFDENRNIGLNELLNINKDGDIDSLLYTILIKIAIILFTSAIKAALKIVRKKRKNRLISPSKNYFQVYFLLSQTKPTFSGVMVILMSYKYKDSNRNVPSLDESLWVYISDQHKYINYTIYILLIYTRK